VQRDEVTALLLALGNGEPTAMDRLLPLVYEELQRLAHGHRRGWWQDTPGTTSLVHEAYLKLVDQTQVEWHNRAQFFYIASRAMRSVLVDDARRRSRRKRLGDRDALPLEEELLAADERSADLLALDEVLDRLRGEDGRLADIVECRFFGGLTVEETGEAIGVSPATVKRGWLVARAWLHRAMSPGAIEIGEAP
jgi:RNA polymerase sigma factor (TIGR02999 family)